MSTTNHKLPTWELEPINKERRRKAASELAKNYTKNLRRNDNENPIV